MGAFVTDVGSMLEPFQAALDQSTLVVDFDGTLAPIVAEPAQARALPEARLVLGRLSNAGVRVAVVSGRPLSFLDEHCDFIGDRVGLYGIERRVGGSVWRDPRHAAWTARIAEIAEQAPPGPRIEVKGPSLTAHFRSAPHLEAAVVAWAHDQAGDDLEVRAAKASVELHPIGGVDKGEVLADLVNEASGPLLFAGDDVGDKAAFAVLRAERARGRDVLGVLVGSDETQPQLRDFTDVEVDGPPGLVRLLEGLLPAQYT